MTGFSADWLKLREPVDAASRNPELTVELRAWRQGLGLLSVLDLGSGTGANLRFLAPLLGGEQHWWLVDHDPALLARGDDLLRPLMVEWRLKLGLEWRLLDLDLDWERLEAGDVHLVTASALIDLVSIRWLERLARRCRQWRAAVFFTLGYDGSIAWEPALGDDENTRQLVNRHQRTDKGFGPALGPDAPATLAILLRDFGYWVMLRPSPWRLGPGYATIQSTLLEGWVEVARQLDPESTHWLDDWSARRHRLIERRESSLYVGHWDLLARLDVA